MSNHPEEHDGPIHQAVWVFPLTLFACYAFLVLVMGAKWAANSVNAAEFFEVFGVQAVMMVGFLVFFGAVIYGCNKLLGAIDAEN